MDGFKCDLAGAALRRLLRSMKYMKKPLKLKTKRIDTPIAVPEKSAERDGESMVEIAAEKSQQGITHDLVR